MAFFDFLSKKMDAADYEQVGLTIADRIYFKELAIYIATSYIADTISKCEIKTYEGGKEVKNNLYYMLNYNPNPNQSSSQFMHKVVTKLCRESEALVVPWRDSMYCADGFGVEDRPLKEDIFSGVVIDNQNVSKKFKASEVFRFQLGDQSVRSLIDSLYSDYGVLMASALDSYKRVNADKYKLVLENVQAGDPAFAKQFNDVIKKQLDSFMNSDRAVYPQFRGQELQRMETGGTASSADVIALRKEVFEIVAQAYKIPMTMMYGNITNMNEIVKVFLSFCIDPIAEMISKELTRKTNTFDTWSKGNKVMVDTSRINHVSIMECADKADKAIASGITNIDEMREQFDMEPLNTDYSRAHFITKNYALADTALDSLGGGE